MPISPSASPAPPTTSFHRFPKLPGELRTKIWHLAATERQRILKLRLVPRVLLQKCIERGAGIPPATPGRRDHEPYSVVVDGYQTVSKMFRVNRESRGMALAFYRVHLPCWMTKGASRRESLQRGMLYFNPEHDFLYIRNNCGPTAFADFIHQLKTKHDGRNIGLLNLAIEGRDLSGWGGLCRIYPAKLDPPQEKSFADTLTQLREVFFVVTQHHTGRHAGGHRDGVPYLGHQQGPVYPITAMSLTFERLKSDPRPISRDLIRIFVDSDPRHVLHWWEEYFRNYFDGVIPPTEQRVLLAIDPIDYEIYDQLDGERWLQQEARSRLLGEGSESTVETVFGFWLFPTQAFGSLPRDSFIFSMASMPSYMDLRQHWPELGRLTLL